MPHCRGFLPAIDRRSVVTFLSQTAISSRGKASDRVASCPRRRFAWLAYNSIPFNKYLVENLLSNGATWRRCSPSIGCRPERPSVAYCLAEVAVREPSCAGMLVENISGVARIPWRDFRGTYESGARGACARRSCIVMSRTNRRSRIFAALERLSEL